MRALSTLACVNSSDILVRTLVKIMGEELALKVLQNLSSTGLFTMCNVPRNLPAEPQKFCRILGNLWEPGPVL